MITLRSTHAPFIRFVLSQSTATLGRSSQCDFVVGDKTVSRKHAEILVSESGLHVTDLGSRNGTFLDDQRIRISPVGHGQIVRFGNVPFVVILEKLAKDEPSSLETDAPAIEIGDSETLNLDKTTKLSEAQKRVFDFLLTGVQEKTIARRLDLSHHTVHNHIRAIYQTLGVHSRAELLASYIQKKDRKTDGR
jgi:pSer/pThr/pTyr-binding forkhead associated (FHA) protein